MTAARLDIKIEQGATYDFTATVRSGGAYMDLTGYTARMSIRKHPESATALLALVSPASAGTGIDLGGTAGTVRTQISATDTAALDFYIAYYDLEIVSGAGKVIRLYEGRVTLSREVTK